MQVLKNPLNKDDLIVTAFMMGLLLPLRLVFYQYLSHYWIGSVGVLSVIILSLVYLARKQKLGGFGRALLRTIEKRTKGKTFKTMIIMSGLVLYFGSLMITGITYANPIIYQKVENQFNNQGINDTKSLIKYDNTHQNLDPNKMLVGVLVLATPNEISFTAYKIMNDFSGGWFLPIITISMVETLEMLCIVLYLRRGGKLIRKEMVSVHCRSCGCDSLERIDFHDCPRTCSCHLSPIN